MKPETITLCFLDIKIQRADRFYTRTFYKPTYTGLYTSFVSFIPEKYKHNIIQVLFYRIKSFRSMHEDFQYLTETLLKNKYPLRLIQSSIKSVLENMYRPRAVLQTCAKKQIFLVFPFTGKHGIQLRMKMNKLFRVHF